VIRLRYLAFAVLGAFAIVLVVATGVIPIQASSGHWKATAWVLDLIKRRSVNTFSRSIEVPALIDPALVVRGAGHYERSCRACHGSPAAARPPLVMKMTPHPPFLPERIGRWDDAELFQIVKHGIKFTGMPAWPAPKRNDEIWAVVAFLRRMPGLSPDHYWRLAVGEPRHPGASPPIIEMCAACHGADGRGRDGGAFPTIAGQNAPYLRRALDAYATGQRHSGIMGPIAAAMDARTRDALIDYYSKLPPPTSRAAGRDVARGEAIAQRGIAERRIPACLECHQPDADQNREYPILDGQHAEFLLQQLQLFNEDARGGSGLASTMRPIAMRLTPEEMQAVAAYFSTRPPRQNSRASDAAK
jgi:cytochrome c553/cytochrome c5